VAASFACACTEAFESAKDLDLLRFVVLNQSMARLMSNDE